MLVRMLQSDCLARMFRQVAAVHRRAPSGRCSHGPPTVEATGVRQGHTGCHGTDSDPFAQAFAKAGGRRLDLLWRDRARAEPAPPRRGQLRKARVPHEVAGLEPDRS